MTESSLRVSPDTIKRANTRLAAKGYDHRQLAEQLKISDLLVDNFFSGQVIDYETFVQVCQGLGLTVRAKPKADTSINVSGLHTASKHPILPKIAPKARDNSQQREKQKTDGSDHAEAIALLVQAVRKRVSRGVQRLCNRLKVLDMVQPLRLSDIYTELNFCKTIRSRKRVDLATLNAAFQAEHDELVDPRKQQDYISGWQAIENYSHLIILGNLGTGKTSFLKYVALQCDAGNFQPHRIPIFISLKDFAENQVQPSLQEYIAWKLSNYRAADDRLIRQLLVRGRFLILLDGLDEVRTADSNRVIRQIRDLSDLYHRNSFVITSRPTSYIASLEEFTELEIAGFQYEQITTFANKWFQLIDPHKSEKFLRELNHYPHYQDLAATPLLLTLLCSVYAESGQLTPAIYQEALHLFLQEWQMSKAETEATASNGYLSISQKKDLLSYLALTTLDRREFVFDRHLLECSIRTYLSNYPSLATLPVDTDALVKSFAIEHNLLQQKAKGIYAFSHLAFQQYLAAVQMAANASPEMTNYLLDRTCDRYWHPIFLFLCEAWSNPDAMLLQMKQKIDALLAQDQHLQNFLCWVKQHCEAIRSTYKPAAIRAMYFDFDFENVRKLDRNRALEIAHSRSLERAQARALGIKYDMDTEIDIDLSLRLALNFDLAKHFIKYPILKLARYIDPSLDVLLRKLKSQLPNYTHEPEKFSKWWQVKGLDWSKDFRNAIIHPRKVNHDWEFNEQQLLLLRQYIDANKLLLDCMNKLKPRLSSSAIAEIETTLFLPVVSSIIVPAVPIAQPNYDRVRLLANELASDLTVIQHGESDRQTNGKKPRQKNSSGSKPLANSESANYQSNYTDTGLEEETLAQVWVKH